MTVSQIVDTDTLNPRCICTSRHFSVQIVLCDIRMAQYESGSRCPKADLTQSLADVLGVSTMALNVPDIDTDLGFMHTLFALEDIYGLKIDKLDDEVCIRLDKNRGTSYISLLERFTAWQKEAEKYRNGEISKEEYDHWRYTYPEVEVQRTRDALDKIRAEKKMEEF